MTWSAQEPLAQRWRLVIIDRPGFGTSSPVDRVDFEADAELVVEILDRATGLSGVDRVHLVGHSSPTWSMVTSEGGSGGPSRQGERP